MRFPTHYIEYCVQWSSLALLWYDYILTLPSEVKFVWGRRITPFTLLYACCRYALVANILYLLSIGGRFTKTCDTGYRICSGLAIVGRFAIIVVWTKRTWILFDKNRLVLIYLSTLGLAAMILDCIQVPYVDCDDDIPKVTVILTAVMCAFEASSAGFTLYSFWRAYVHEHDAGRLKGSLTQVMNKGGVQYLCLALCLVITSLVFDIRYKGVIMQRLLSALALPISGTMTARFLLDLQKWQHRRSVGQDSISMETSSPLQFSRNPQQLHSLIDNQDVFAAMPIIEDLEPISSPTEEPAMIEVIAYHATFEPEMDRGEGCSQHV